MDDEPTSEVNDQSTKTAVREMKRHPLAIAWDEWLASDEGQGCATFSNLVAGPYLENRLHAAFRAGAAARPGVSDADKELLRTLSSALKQCAVRVIGDWGGCWCKHDPLGSSNAIDHESECDAARDAIAEYDNSIERLGQQ